MKSITIRSISHPTYSLRIGLVLLFLSVFPVFGGALASCNWAKNQSDPEAELQKRRQIEASLTLLENRNNLIPFDRLDTLTIAALSVGDSIPTEFQHMLANYMKVDFYNLPKQFTAKDLTELTTNLKKYNLVIAGIHSIQKSELKGADDSWNGFEQLNDYLIREKTSVVCYFCDPKLASEVKSFGKPAGLIMAFQNDSLTQSLAAQMIFGGTGAKGKLQFDVWKDYHTGDGILIEKAVRLKYTIPEEVGIKTSELQNPIDSIVNDALDKKAFPGCNVLVAKDGEIIFRKAYGYETFERQMPAHPDDIYDLASVTKISGGLPGILKLYDERKIELDKPVANYYPDWKSSSSHKSDKSNVTVRELYTHQSGLVPFISFYKTTIKDGKPSPEWYTTTADEQHPLCVAQGMYLDKKFLRLVTDTIRKVPLKTRGKYVYSDLPLVITPQIVKNISGIDFREFVESNFYRPLGASELTYLPLQKFSRDRIVPTENDQYYRFQLLQGTVHDESAAVLGGISGNAGLFASANDLAKLMEMYLQLGLYGGKQYVSEATMKEFTRVQFPKSDNRRGLIFDKPALDNKRVKTKDAYPCAEASDESFGHSGYTGTFVWMDPKYNLLYIFLSNRVCPTRENTLISDLNVRTKILSAIYKSFGK
ncbi:beta-hexosaminidase [Aquipluma nitroreducens]|uniref:Beta-hexosaminidase n=1 Tax=Aquipluma nitroreducens TaxID=2010828 RepID=A0A5K7SEL9_9BACT|nr:serine hydrolase [Aquipluma nitroreducens]BBE20003.1 beta-hexosaminidase [Aquipluma nitroreducens]